MDKKRFHKIMSNLFSVKYEGYTKIVMVLGIRFRFYDYKACLQDTNQLVRDMNFKQNLIMDYFMDVTEAKEATGALRNRQIENLELLKEFIRVCHLLKVDYWLDDGTLLGAVRNNKTIPWDDDCDVAVTEHDMKIILSNIHSILGESYDLINIVECCQYRIISKRYVDAFVDIYVYREEEEMYFYLGFKDCIKDRDFLPKKVIFPLKNIIFENVEARVPFDCDKYLRNRYGNYNLLPKKEHIMPGHIQPQEHIVFKK